MILKYNTNYGTANQTVSLPLYGTVNVSVNWGDGATSATTSTGELSHTYSADGHH